MKQILVRYKTAPDKADENQRLIENVFKELQAKTPDGMGYLVLRLADGTFVHFKVDTREDADPIHALDAFRTFQSSIKERCIEPPQAMEATIVGNYRVLSER